MTVPEPLGAALSSGAPELSFTVLGCEPLPHAAAPTLRFSLAIDAGGAAVRSVMLEVQVRIAATQRGYSDAEQAQLGDLFGAPHQWADTLRGLLWTHATAVVVPFQGATVIDLLVPCTYDFDVAAAKYLSGLQDGEIPLDLLFSGTVFYAGVGGALQINRISWNAEAAHRLPVRVWRETMDLYFPGNAWLRLDRETFDRLVAFRARRALTDWEAVLDALLAPQEQAP
ncbi:MAG: hypothetical protein DLM64_07380 [Solirubrobacterales bacterium]|nr:MAG: hypothetical protein DLM64_07380 [Solirubrobacterales bacterium]